MFCERHCEGYIGSGVSGISLSQGCLIGFCSSIEQLTEGHAVVFELSLPPATSLLWIA